MPIDLTSTPFANLCSNIEKGNVVLFCGAGFSVDAHNLDGNPPPLSRELAQKLADLAGVTYSGESLPVTFDGVQSKVGTAGVHEFLQRLYTVSTQADWYELVARFVWHRIYTTNIDNLLDEIYTGAGRRQRLRRIVCPASPVERDAYFQTVQCVHLHGHVQHLSQGLVFSFDDFAKQQAAGNSWYLRLIDDLFFRPVVFIGTALEDSPLHHYLALRGLRDERVRETRPKSYLVSPRIGPLQADALKKHNILPVECTAQEFFEALKARFEGTDLSLNAVRRRAAPHAFIEDFRDQDAILKYFDPVYPATLPPSPRRFANNFYLGAEPTWQDIEEERDAHLETCAVLDDALRRHNDKFHCLVLFGAAGCGKSTIMKRAAYTLATAGERVYFAKTGQRIEFDGIIRLAEEVSSEGNRVYVFVDNLRLQASSIVHRLQAVTAANGLTLVLADRLNAYSMRARALAPLNPTEIRVADLTESDAHSVIGRLEHFNFLGALASMTPDERIDEFMGRASRQLLVALREATSGRGFDDILSSEYNELLPEAKLAYTICCLAVAQGAPGVHRRHLLPCLGETSVEKASIISDLLNGVLVIGNHTGTLLRPRHRIIAYEVAVHIAAEGVKYESIVTLLRQISGDIVPSEIRRKTAPYLAYRGLINSEGLKHIFGDDADAREMIISVYQQVEPFYKNQFLFWLHYAMAYMSQGDLDIAETYLNQALAICEQVRADAFQIHHQRGILYLTQAFRSIPATAGVERANRGIDLLYGLIVSRGDYDPYSYGAYADYVSRWYAHAGQLISDAQWDELVAIAREGAAKHRLDDRMRETRDRVERAYLLRATESHRTDGETEEQS